MTTSQSTAPKAKIKPEFNYTETAPVTRMPPVQEKENPKRLCAHDLFSSFTADIINENTAFTR